MNPFRKIANSLMNWWKGETAPEVSDSTELTGGVMTLNSPSFLESMGLSRRRKTTSEVTYFTCLKMLSETLAKMPIKYYQRTDKGIIEAEQTDTSRLLTKRPNPFMTPTVFWNTVEINRNHYGNAYVYIRKKFIRKKYGGEVKILDLWVMQSNCIQIVVDDAGIFAGKGRLYAVTKAEKELGAGTGKLKLRYVYDMFVARFEWLAKVITFDMFSMMVDEALEQMRTMLDSNEAVQKLIANEAGEGSE